MTAERGKVLILNKANLIRFRTLPQVVDGPRVKNLPPRMNYRNQINVGDHHYNLLGALCIASGEYHYAGTTMETLMLVAVCC